MRKRFFPLTLVFLLVACSALQSAGGTHPPAVGETPTSVASTSTPFPSVTFATSPSERGLPSVMPSLISTQTFIVPTPWPTATLLAPLQAGETLSMATLYMMDAVNGWGIESRGYVLRTTDGGQTWKDVTPSQGIFIKGGFFALNADEAWAFPYLCFSFFCPDSWYATIWHTIDGGTTWQPSQPICLGGPGCKYDYELTTQDLDPIAMQFVNRQTGWLLVNTQHLMMSDHCRLYQTTDGGNNWDLLGGSATLPCGYEVKGIAFLDANTGWMGNSMINSPIVPGTNWGISATRDGGQSWQISQLPPPADLPTEFAGKPGWCDVENVSTIPPQIVDLDIDCRVDNGGGTPKYHYHSVNGGGSWHSWQVTGSVQFIDVINGWALVPSADGGLGLLQRTEDGGWTWTTIKHLTWQGVQFDFINRYVGWAIATSGDTSALVHTVDGGLTWTEIRPIVVP